MNGLRCPTEPRTSSGEPHSIIGCGSERLSKPDEEGLVDCLDCGIFFDPNEEAM